MQIDLSGMKILITGASSGFGFEMSRALLGCGADVAMASRPGEKLLGAVRRVKADGFSPLVLPMDVRDENSIEKARERLEETWGGLDMLVNNAGISMSGTDPDFRVQEGLFYEIKPSAFRDIVETNFVGYFLVSRAFTPIMLRQGRGRIVNVSTSIATMTAKRQIPYGPARAGAEAMTMILAAEMEELGITVNVLLPGGASDTGMVLPSRREAYLARGGILPPTILNEAVIYLASPAAEGVTGRRFIGKEFKWETAGRKEEPANEK